MTTSTCSAAATGLLNPLPFDPDSLPDIYGMNVAGGCMAPEIPDRCNIKVSKTEPWGFQDVVVVWLRPDLVKPGMPPAIIKRVAMVPPPWVKEFPCPEDPRSEVQAVLCLSRDDHPHEMMTVRCSAIAAVHRCVGILAPEETDSSFLEAADRDRQSLAEKKPSRRQRKTRRRPISFDDQSAA